MQTQGTRLWNGLKRINLKRRKTSLPWTARSAASVSKVRSLTVSAEDWRASAGMRKEFRFESKNLITFCNLQVWICNSCEYPPCGPYEPLSESCFSTGWDSKNSRRKPFCLSLQQESYPANKASTLPTDRLVENSLEELFFENYLFPKESFGSLRRFGNAIEAPETKRHFIHFNSFYGNRRENIRGGLLRTAFRRSSS